MEGDENIYELMALQMSQVEFPFLEGLYLQYKAPRLCIGTFLVYPAVCAAMCNIFNP